ncbi:hypothetical protein FACS1894133_4850 [Clostridia bacterium]|nr:hypothetical protein FACS1894133_4850 [Clostridia bacterium]
MYLAEFSYFDDVRREAFFDGKSKGKLEVLKKLIPLGWSEERLSDVSGIAIQDLRKFVARD